MHACARRTDQGFGVINIVICSGCLFWGGGGGWSGVLPATIVGLMKWQSLHPGTSDV